MANLSNINNKFLVTTTGEVLIGQTAAVGTSKLQVTGASSPLAIHTPSGNNGLEFILDNGLYTNWQIGVQNQVGNALTIVPSTAAGNTTFSTPVATFLSSGNVGIGTVSPNAKLEVNVPTGGGILIKSADVGTLKMKGGGGVYDWGLASTYLAASDFGIYKSNAGGGDPITAGTAQLYFKAISSTTSNVGIGTTSPTAKLDIKSSLTAIGTEQLLTIGHDINWNLKLQENWNASGIQFDILQKYGTGAAANVLTFFNGKVGIGTTSPGAKLVIGTVAGAASGQLNFERTDGAETGQIYMDTSNDLNIRNTGGSGDIILYPHETTGNTIVKTGNVGIGTDSPDALLELSKDAAGAQGATLRLTNSVGGAGAGSAVEFVGPGTQPIHAKIITEDAGAYDSDLIFQTKATGTGGALADRLTIDNAGNVGIGTTSPEAKLDISNVAGATYALEISTPERNRALFFYNSASTSDAGYLGIKQGSVDTLNHRFATTGNSAVCIEEGNFGIGTDSPTQKLNVVNDNTGTWTAKFTNNTNNVYLSVNDANNYGIYVAGETTNYFSGNIGIGTTSPNAKLDVVMLNSGGATRQDIFRLLQSGQNTLSCYMYGGTTDLVQLHVSGPEQHLSLTTGGGATATTLTGIHIRSGGNVGINTQNATGNLTVESGGNQLHLRASTATAGKYWNLDVASNNIFYIVNNSSNGVFITDGGTSWTGISDETVKENIKPLENVLDKIKDYRCVEYNLKSVPNHKKIGFIAQDWVDDFAPIISKDDEGLLGMKYTETIPILLKAIQELKAEIELLKNK